MSCGSFCRAWLKCFECHLQAFKLWQPHLEALPCSSQGSTWLEIDPRGTRCHLALLSPSAWRARRMASSSCTEHQV